MSRPKHQPKKHLHLKILLAIITLFVLFNLYLLLTRPSSQFSIVKPAFTTSYVDNQVTLTQNYKPHILSGWLANAIGFYKQALTIVWARYSPEKISADNEQTILANIHALRFDPSKPYVISGDQFDGLYLRNLGVFYQDLLNRQTALNDNDWHNRQRIAVQTVAYGLEALTQLGHPVTTLLPISPKSMVAIDVYSYPSDTIFSLMFTLDKLDSDPATHQVARQLLREYGDGLTKAYNHYLTTVRDTKTGLILNNVALASARDAVKRQSSFYDNVVMWRTMQLASKLGLDNISDAALAQTKQTILKYYWNNPDGHFIDDAVPGHEHSYCSDWLIALQTGFLQPDNPEDLAKLVRISTFIDTTQLAHPLPIKYTEDTNNKNDNLFVKTFVGTYGNTAIWSYWGSQYIAMQIALYTKTKQPLYANHVNESLDGWRKVIIRNKSYPETLDGNGQLLKNLFYKSIMRNGWVVSFEADELLWRQTAQ